MAQSPYGLMKESMDGSDGYTFSVCISGTDLYPENDGNDHFYLYSSTILQSLKMSSSIPYFSRGGRHVSDTKDHDVT